MILADFVAGDAVFVDANPLVYHFGPHAIYGPPCQQFLQRIENLEIRGFTSTHVLAEVMHQLMNAEASKLPGWSLGKIKLRLRQQPSALQNLAHFRRAVEAILQSKLQVLQLAPPLLSDAAALSQQHGLLTNDALIVALMQHQGLTKIASQDADFDRVPGITRYTPA